MKLLYPHSRSVFIHGFLLTLIAWAIRIAVFTLWIGPNGWYKQPDSESYHLGALSLIHTKNFFHLHQKEPIFWRTPGYPLFLKPFYQLNHQNKPHFDAFAREQHYAIYAQICITAFIPIIIYILAQAIGASSIISWIAAWISAIHPGFVLASTYILTDSLGSLFFYLFLIFLFLLLQLKNNITKKLTLSLIAAACLSIYTWMRPMGELVGFLTTILIFLFSAGSWIENLLIAFIFCSAFIGTLVPWYIRNYKLTGNIFFCPTLGIYLNVFCVARIIRNATGKSLEYAHKIASENGAKIFNYGRQFCTPICPYVSPMIVTQVCWPFIRKYPWWFITDWIRECCKTAFDIYGSQITAFFKNSYYYDPLEEFISKKIAENIWKTPMPWSIRAIIWTEYILTTWMWIGIFFGIWLYIIQPCIRHRSLYVNKEMIIWIVSLTLIGFTISMTGGFGYARLRLPIEPLLLILSLQSWHSLYEKYYRYKSNLKNTSNVQWKN